MNRMRRWHRLSKPLNIEFVYEKVIKMAKKLCTSSGNTANC